jgi:hypothetical protein
MSDKLVFDLSQEVDGSPNVFVKKDYLNILDNMNGNYAGNQSVIDTSQLSNSNKWMSYREGYLYIPMLLSLQGAAGNSLALSTAATSGNYCLGLKNWFGSIIHSFTLDMNGTTIIQQTPFCNMWNSFKLMTSLSINELTTLGPTIGFYPDNPLSWSFNLPQDGTVADPNAADGTGTTNNTNFLVASPVVNGTVFNGFKSGQGNEGLLIRQQYINYDPAGVPVASAGASTYGALLPELSVKQLWKSYISNKTATVIQHSISAVVYLKHLHSFFQFTPLLKGVYMKMTLNLNNSNTLVNVTGIVNANSTPVGMGLGTVSVPSGGINPVMIASVAANNGSNKLKGLTANGELTPYTINLSVGATCLNNTITSAGGQVGRNIYLYVPAYTFNPIFEQAYLSSPIKSIKYTDIYQYQVTSIGATQSFNQLITNGIANIKSVLILPFYAVASNTTGAAGIACYQSPFDPAGAGPTSPLAHFSNFNVVISGQNAIYNTQRYAFEEWNNQLYGANAVNGGLMDGLTSGLISQLGWEMEYCYYYVNVSRMLPVEEAVPKSVQILGQNVCGQALDLIVFVEYGVSVDIDILTGSRVG